VALAPLVSLVSAVGIGALVAGLAMAAACLVWRYRHGSVRERRQLAWVALGTTAMVVGVALLFVGRYADLTTQEEGERLAMLAAVGAVLLPLAMVRYAMVTDALGQQTSDLTFLFTDLKDSTAMYERVGDVTAFDIVRLHFDTLESATRRHGGAIVKTLGDAIMARFFEPEDAVGTALEMFERLAPFDAVASANLVLKVGLHRGDAIVVTSKGRRDYFGQTVNIAARMQALAEAGEIVLSHEVYESPGVARLLAGREVRAEQAVIRGVSGEVSVFRVLVAPPVAASPTLEPAT
jgi:class 3 adenylate cyclase